MHIEVWQALHGGQRWYWHFRARNGKIVSDAEGFPTKANALRAAKAIMRAVCRPYVSPAFTIAPHPKRPGVTVIRWG